MYTKVQNAFTSRYLCYCTNKNHWNSIIYYNHEQKRQLHTFENPYRVRNLRETSKTQQLSFIAFYQFVLKLPAVFTKAKQTTYFNFKQENTFQICNFGIFCGEKLPRGTIALWFCVQFWQVLCWSTAHDFKTNCVQKADFHLFDFATR